MSLSARDAMVLAALVPDTRTRLLGADDRERLASQFSMRPEQIDVLAARITGEIESARSLLDSCQPKNVARCPHCAHALKVSVE